MYRKPRASVFADFLHKGFVVTCVGVTVYGLYLIGMRAERYFSVVRPQQKLRELEQQKTLLAEGRVSSEELRP